MLRLRTAWRCSRCSPRAGACPPTPPAPAPDAMPSAANASEGPHRDAVPAQPQRRAHGLPQLREQRQRCAAPRAGYSRQMVRAALLRPRRPERLDAAVAHPAHALPRRRPRAGRSARTSPGAPARSPRRARSCARWMHSPGHRAQHPQRRASARSASASPPARPVPPAARAGATYTTDFGVTRRLTASLRRRMADVQPLRALHYDQADGRPARSSWSRRPTT